MSSLEILSRSLLEGAGKQLAYSTLLAALVWMICQRLDLRAPRLQLGLWSLVTLRLVLPPGLASPWSLRALFAGWAPLDLNVSTLEMGAGAPGLSSAVSAAPSTAPTTQLWPLVLCSFWGIGSLLVASRMYSRWHRYRSIAFSAPPLMSENWQGLLHRWRSRLGIRQSVLLVASDACSVPFTVGWLRPRIFLPLSLAQTWPKEQVEAIVAHELAHIRRRDSLWIGLHCLVRAAYFFHPALWLANSRLDQTRERVCDELVLSTGAIHPRTYGECLVAILRQQISLPGTTGAVPVPTFAQDKRRMSMRLLGIVHHRPSHRSHRAAALILPWLLGLLLLPMGSIEAERGNSKESSLDTLATSAKLPASSSEAAPLPWSSPLPGARITSPFGFRKSPLDKNSESHRGIDLVGPKGAEILAPADGRVEIATELLEGHAKLGTTVLVDHGNGLKSRYAHLGSLLVKEQQTVRAGQPIAIQGNTGASTGPHLHFEVWRDGEAIDPATVVGKW
ncbi:MAG: peptidoglycan DD-metalloendopeptidase family protein [Deltaproteobacteria bacterium]|nr:peptidoglycan DD-metalloendopeptidase family protein [Deltaproteobacteria bacterium]